MTQKNHIYEADTIGLSFRMVIGTVPSPDPVDKRRIAKNQERPVHEMEIPIKRLINHLLKDGK